MSGPIPFQACARLAGDHDNVAIATRTIDAGSRLVMPKGEQTLPFTVLLGHRFAVASVGVGDALLSWGRPFGQAIRPIAAGEYVCNEEILRALSVRRAAGSFPETPNFVSRILPYQLDEETFHPAPPTGQVELPATFQGYQRTGGRGMGTRNFIVLLGTSSRTGSFVRQLAARLAPLARNHPSIDGIVPVAHTEGGDVEMPNNREEVLRTLAGFMVHPNVGAVLAVDHGVEPINNRELRDWMVRKGYPLDHVLHRFLGIDASLAAASAGAEAQVHRWLPQVAAASRVSVGLSGLCIGLQCGGSDAFSGISGNPLVGAVGHEIIRHGGRVCLTETDELIGAEEHMLGRVRNLDTARRFLAAIEHFKERLSWHGATAEGNPSGGNQLRGLYNITLKSLGAAAKKSPLTRLDRVGDYAERILEPGFSFMDGPGSDLEGIAGQVAAGCNLLLFVTGNGSVTNFPFVPTIKFTTTTARHQLLEREMDVNAGRYLDGEPMDRLRDETFERVRAVASGERTKGEKAGHSQVMIWRNWRQTEASEKGTVEEGEPDGKPITRPATVPGDDEIRMTAWRVGNRWALDRIGLILPVSMCSAEIARLASERLNAGGLARLAGLSRFVALIHTEGCGSTGAALYRQLARTYRGYLTHPHVAGALVLEHGCEKIPNDVLKKSLRDAGIDETRFGWASVQLDGGMEKVLDRIEAWFASELAAGARPPGESVGLGALSLGLLSAGKPNPGLGKALGHLADRVLRSGGSVLLPVTDPLVADAAFCECVIPEGSAVRPTLAYGQPLEYPGLHLVDTETRHWVENLTGLGACGAGLLLGAIADHPREGHPFLPVLQVAAGSPNGRLTAESVDLILPTDEARAESALAELLRAAAAGALEPRTRRSGLTDFQITRGRFGVTS